MINPILAAIQKAQSSDVPRLAAAKIGLYKPCASKA